ncbi:MAG: hypothetical protein ACK58T_04080, partial [Phycisphaerae bacterium]
MKIIAVAPDPGTARQAWRIASGGAVDPGRSTVAQIADRSIPCSGADAISRFAAVRRSRSPWLTSRSGRDVPQAVTRKVMEEVDNPLAQDQISILGTLLQGEENGREGVVIFSAPDMSARELTVFATGFSGETAA